jgi:DNA uptake protein ComE-like DNA-binding protein
MEKWLTCTPYERRGFIALIGLILLTSAAGRWLPPVQGRQPEAADIARWETILDHLEGQDSLPAAAALFPFDPNTAGEDELLRLGLPDWIARRILRYREAGGRFRTKTDLRRIYGFSEADYRRLEAYIRLPQAATAVGARLDERPAGATVELSPRAFDPNRVTVHDLLAMGLPERVARTWEKYRQAGGRFYRPEDLDKLYGLRPEWAAALKPFVELEDPAPGFAVEKREKIRIDINEASPEEWRRLRGIGRVYSERIVRFRDALGGFSHIDQVADTYGLPDSTFQAIRPKLVLRVGIYRKVPLNSASVDQLAGHPYLSKRQAAAIFAYRQHHGPFAAVEDINKTMVLSRDNYEKIWPYLSLE